jgi:SAM-dependent methyltransferase
MCERGRNPWLSIPASDYEGHMASPSVQQLQYLGSVFEDLIATYRPLDLAVLGCATGNGFDRIPPETHTVIGLDINPEYLELARARHAERLPGLELVCADFAAYTPEPRSLDLIYAGLFLEYVEPAVVFAKSASWLRPHGILAVVVQLPAARAGPITATCYSSLKALEPVLRLVDPREVARLAIAQGFTVAYDRKDTLPTGKELSVGVYALGGPAPVR